MSESSFTLLGDQPYSGSGDPLGFEQAVEGIESLILGSRDSTPFSLGIEGSWGVGKSTLMAALQERLKKRPEITVAQFNSWTAEDGQVLEGFVKTVLSAVKPRYLRNALLKQKAIGLTRFGLSSAAGVVGQSRTVEKVWDAVASDPRARNELRDLVEATVESWRKSRGDTARLLCVFVDDLDRCYPGVVLEVLEAMKLYLDVPGIVFVVGYDEDIVTEVVLGKKGYGEKTTARSYLEKFIQISYRVPRPDTAQADALVEELLAHSGVGELLGEAERQLVVARSGSNPRRIKRFINNFVLLNSLERGLRELDPQSLVRVLLLQMYFPQFARLLEEPSERDPTEEFLEYEAARTALLRRRLTGVSKDIVEQAMRNHSLAYGDLDRENPEDLLRRLEQEVSVDFPALALNDDFVALVRSISESVDWPAVRLEVSRGALANVREPTSDDAPSWQRTGFSGLRVAWIDDQPEGNSALVATLIEGGAVVETFNEQLRLEALMRVQSVDLLISDIGRGDNPLAGFAMLDALRNDPEIYEPRAVIFFTGRITPMRIERARELGAEITNERETLLNYAASMSEKIPDV